MKQNIALFYLVDVASAYLLVSIFNPEDFRPQRPRVGEASAFGRRTQHFKISDALGILRGEKQNMRNLSGIL